MPPKSIAILEVEREGGDSSRENIDFRLGMNVLVGLPNTGKTKWMETIDFLLGDDPSPEHRETDDIFLKFDVARMRAVIAGEEFGIERRWKEKGAVTKVFLGNRPLSLDDYRSFLLERLEIRPFHYPQGSLYGDRAWPQLGWRSLVRHVYRRQNMWSDLADKQPASEQHASLLQFLGVGDRVFSTDFESLIAKQNQLATLRAQRDNFISTLQEISRELMQADELSVALTPQSIADADRRFLAEEQKLAGERDALLSNLMAAASTKSAPLPDAVEGLTQTLVKLQSEMEDNANTLKRARNRQAHLREYREILGHEVERLERSISAGNVFADLKVTHCPACDQEVSAADEELGRCYVCKQPLDARATASGVNRIEFELEQIRSEIAELNELLNRLEAETTGLQEHQTLLREKINGTQELLRPVRTAAAAILPPELAITNMSIGRLQEKRRQLQRVKAALDRREILARTIQDIQAEIDKLSGSVTEIASTIDYATLGDRLADGMNTYLNKLNEANKDAWLVGDVSVQLQEKTLRIRVGKSDWQNKLGGTLTLYFLLAYHYALLALMRFPESHFPGLLLIDFPAEVEGASVADKENFVVEPFIDLLSQEGMENCQMVAAASGFFGLEGAHRVELSKVWKA